MDENIEVGRAQVGASGIEECYWLLVYLEVGDDGHQTERYKVYTPGNQPPPLGQPLNVLRPDRAACDFIGRIVARGKRYDAMIGKKPKPKPKRFTDKPRLKEDKVQVVLRVEVELERETGKFASREELEDAVLNAIMDADPGSIDTEDSATYNVTSFNVEVQDPPKPIRKKKAKS